MPDTPKAASEAARAFTRHYYQREDEYVADLARALASFHAAELRKLAGEAEVIKGAPQAAAWLRAEAARWEAT